MLRKIVIISLMALYLYTLTFDIFLNAYFRIPAPFLGFVLIFLFPEKSIKELIFGWEFLFLILADLFYYLIGQYDMKTFVINLSIIITCGLFFKYFIGSNYQRFKAAVIIFILLLFVSTFVMFADRSHPDRFDAYRATLMGGAIVQSPSGICASIFTFGYQLAAMTTFVFLYVLLTKKHFLFVITIFILCLVSIFFGMQRSAFVVFFTVSTLCIILYYRAKSIPIILGALFLIAVFFVLGSKKSDDSQGNILTKNTQNQENGEDRSGLVTEDLKIYASYPLGLVFYNLQWKDVSKNDPAFSGGLTSHNAYLMFFTYLGPFLGLFLFIGVYYSIFKVIKKAVLNIHKQENVLLVCLCSAFLAISLNSLFHNAWLINANGPTVFLYFAVLLLGKKELGNKILKVQSPA
jgi:hypothetical protein